MSKKDEKHPDDVRLQAISIVEAHDEIDDWLGKAGNVKALTALVLLYNDSDAERLLSVLREDFWSGMPS